MTLSKGSGGPVTAMALAVIAVAAAASDGDRFPVFEEQAMKAGRAVWLQNCLGCHGDGTADAPRPELYAQWQARIEQPPEVLYSHAIEGFFGPDYAMMPPRGGNPALTDAEVRSAVDYMVRLVVHYRPQTEK